MNITNIIGLIITKDLIIRSIIPLDHNYPAFSSEIYIGSLDDFPNDWGFSIINEKTFGTEDNWPNGLYFEVDPHILIGPKYLIQEERLYFNIYTHSYGLQIPIYKKYLAYLQNKLQLKLDQYALITSTTSEYKNRFVYVVKSDEQYFIFIKKSIDSNAEILDTIIFESEEETKEFIKKLEVQWLD